jgi:hypothetical protein
VVVPPKTPRKSKLLSVISYPRPQQARNVWFARDPDGNPVEIMRVPRTAQGKAFPFTQI